VGRVWLGGRNRIEVSFGEGREEGEVLKLFCFFFTFTSLQTTIPPSSVLQPSSFLSFFPSLSTFPTSLLRSKFMDREVKLKEQTLGRRNGTKCGWESLERNGTAIFYACEVSFLSLPRLSYVSWLLGRNPKDWRKFWPVTASASSFAFDPSFARFRLWFINLTSLLKHSLRYIASRR